MQTILMRGRGNTATIERPYTSFMVTTERRTAAGMLAQYANPEYRKFEADAFMNAMVEKHEKIN